MDQTPPPRGGWSTTKVAIRSVGGCVVHRTGRIVDIDSTTQAATWSGGSYHQDVSSRGGRPTSQVATRLDAGCVVDQTPLQGGWSTTQARGRSGAECVVRQTPLPWGVWSTTFNNTRSDVCGGPDTALTVRLVDRTRSDAVGRWIVYYVVCVVDQMPPSRGVRSTAQTATCSAVRRGQLAKSPQPEGSESLRRVLELGKDSWEPLAAFGGVSGHLVTP